MPNQVSEVGSPDSERKSSPIFDEDDEIFIDLESEEGVCLFNDAAYPIGQYVRSGSELLRCEGRAVWVPKGEFRPK